MLIKSFKFIKLTDKSNYINEVSLRYANALILISKKSGLKQIQNDFKSFIKLIESNKNLKLIINNPLINVMKKSTILENICKAIKTEKTFLGFVKTLTKHNKIVLIEKVFSQFNKLIDIKEGFTEVHLTTSKELKNEKLKQIEKIISQKIDGKVKLKKKVDPQIIGGIIIQIDSFMIDNSIRSKLSGNFI